MRSFSYHKDLLIEKSVASTRYSSELAVLYFLTRKKKGLEKLSRLPDDFDPTEWFDENKIFNNKPPKDGITQVMRDILKFLPDNYVQSTFRATYNNFWKAYPAIKKEAGLRGSSKYGWVGGTNMGGASDIEFESSNKYDGISVKSGSDGKKTLTTLKNTTPNQIGFETERNISFFSKYVGNNFVEKLKSDVFSAILDIVDKKGEISEKGSRSDNVYGISKTSNGYRLWKYNSKKKTRKVYKVNKKEENPRSFFVDINNIKKDVEWESIFSIMFEKYFPSDGDLKKRLISLFYKFQEGVNTKFEEIYLNNGAIYKTLNLGNKPIIYFDIDHAISIPSENVARKAGINISKFEFKSAIPTGIMYIVELINDITKKKTTFDLFIRYGNRLWGSELTIRAQNAKGLENLSAFRWLYPCNYMNDYSTKCNL